MTKRLERTGGTGQGIAAAACHFTPASAMPLLRGITPLSVS